MFFLINKYDFHYVQFIMVFDGSILNRPIVAATVKDEYEKVLTLLNAELARERVSGLNRVQYIIYTYLNI